MRGWAVLLVLVLLAGCTTERVGGSPTQPSASGSSAPASTVPASTGPVDLRTPLDFARVTPAGTTATSTSVVPGPNGVDLTLEPPFLTVTRLEDAVVQFQDHAGTWGLLLKMTDEDGTVFGDWTAEHVGEQVAVLADGEVIFAPQISDAITAGTVAISGQYTQQEANDLLARLTGR